MQVRRSESAALAEVGLWPKPESVPALIDLLEALADRESDEERKGRLRTIASGFRSLLATSGDLASLLGAGISVLRPAIVSPSTTGRLLDASVITNVVLWPTSVAA